MRYTRIYSFCKIRLRFLALNKSNWLIDDWLTDCLKPKTDVGIFNSKINAALILSWLLHFKVNYCVLKINVDPELCILGWVSDFQLTQYCNKQAVRHVLYRYVYQTTKW